MLDKKKLKELVRFVQSEERADDFKEKVVSEYADDMEFLSAVLEAPSSEIPVIHADHVMTVLEALLFSDMIMQSDLVIIAKALSKEDSYSDSENRFALMIAKRNFFYDGETDSINTICNYLSRKDLNEEIMSKIIKSRGSLEKIIRRCILSFFCTKVQNISDLDLDFIINKTLNSERSYNEFLTIFLDEKRLRRKERAKQKK